MGKVKGLDYRERTRGIGKGSRVCEICPEGEESAFINFGKSDLLVEIESNILLSPWIFFSTTDNDDNGP